MNVTDLSSDLPTGGRLQKNSAGGQLPAMLRPETMQKSIECDGTDKRDGRANEDLKALAGELFTAPALKVKATRN